MITVQKPGLLTTVQDDGRPGYRAFGMPVAGALDPDAYRIANLLVNNDRGAAAIEMTLLGGSFRFEASALVGIAGADLQAKLDDAPVPGFTSLRIPAGGVLSFSGAKEGCRAYLAVRGGIEVPVVLGSRATYTRARVGGFLGRALAKGDVLTVGGAKAAAAPAQAGERMSLPDPLVPRYDRAVELRVVPGPQDDRFPPSTVETFLGAEFKVTNRNDRMGYQLSGPLLTHLGGADIVSDGNVPGAVQVPGSGSPFVMMADCATVGGYAKIATVISADLPRLAQAKAGDLVRFVRCDQGEAVAALRVREAWFEDIARAILAGGAMRKGRAP